MGEICSDLQLEINQAPKDLLCGGRDASVSAVYRPQHPVHVHGRHSGMWVPVWTH